MKNSHLAKKLECVHTSVEMIFWGWLKISCIFQMFVNKCFLFITKKYKNHDQEYKIVFEKIFLFKIFGNNLPGFENQKFCYSNTIKLSLTKTYV